MGIRSLGKDVEVEKRLKERWKGWEEIKNHWEKEKKKQAGAKERPLKSREGRLGKGGDTAKIYWAPNLHLTWLGT